MKANSMKATGITRKVDELGRVVLPIELRRNLGIEVTDTLEIFTEGDNIILRRYDAVDDLLTMANRLKNRIAAEGSGESKAVLLSKLEDIENIIMSSTGKR